MNATKKLTTEEAARIFNTACEVSNITADQWDNGIRILVPDVADLRYSKQLAESMRNQGYAVSVHFCG